MTALAFSREMSAFNRGDSMSACNRMGLVIKFGIRTFHFEEL